MHLTSRLAALSAGQLSDGMAQVGLSGDGLFGIYPITPDSRIVGRARTVVFRPVNEAEAGRKEYLGYVNSGDALVLGNAGRLHCSVWGGQRSLGAIQRGAVGTVVDGAYRDVQEHVDLGYPVFGRAATIVSSVRAVVPVAVNEVLSIGMVTVTPGDYVVGDASGVIVIPEARAADVVEATEAITADELRIAEAVLAGEDFLTVRGRSETA